MTQAASAGPVPDDDAATSAQLRRQGVASGTTNISVGGKAAKSPKPPRKPAAKSQPKTARAALPAQAESETPLAEVASPDVGEVPAVPAPAVPAPAAPADVGLDAGV